MSSIDASFDAGELCSVFRTTEQGKRLRDRDPSVCARLCLFPGTSEIDKVAVGFRSERSLGQARSDGLGDVQGSRALGNFLNAPVGELHVNAVCHRLELVLC